MEFIEIKRSSGGDFTIYLPISTSITISDMSGRIIKHLGEMSVGEHLVSEVSSVGCIIVSAKNRVLQSVVYCH